MNDLYKSIDIAQLEFEKEPRYYVEGWIIWQKQTDFEMMLLADGTEKIPCQIQWKERPDIEPVLKGMEIPEKPGFSVYVSKISSVFDKYDKLELCVVSGSERRTLFELDIDQIKDDYSKMAIVYNIEHLEILGPQLIIQGWAFEWEYQGEVEIQVLDDQDRVIPHRLNRIVRLDVNKGYGILNDKCQAGINMSLKQEEVKTDKLKVHFIHNGSFCEYVIDMKKLRAEFSKWGRLKTALKEKEENAELIRKKGWKAFYVYLKNKMDPCYADYDSWIHLHSASAKVLRAQKRKKFDYEPKVSVIIPLYNTPLNFLEELMDSLTGQSYQNIEICLADGSTDNKVGEYIQKKYGKDTRVLYKKLKENRGISENTNEAFHMATGDYIMLSDHDDLVAKDAVFEIVKAINKNPEKVDIVYTDEDKITMDGKHYFEPNFKPDFNLDFLRSSNYICHIFVVRRSILEKIGGFRSEFDGAQDFDLILRCCEQAQEIVHVPKVLYHWRSHPLSTAENPDSKMYAFEAGRKALEQHYQRVGLDAEASLTPVFGRYRTTFKTHGQPKVSIIIPNKDHVDDLNLCIESVVKKTSYANYEILVVENNSTEEKTFTYYKEELSKYPQVKLITWEKEFNYAAINNYAVKACEGEYLVFLNNDTEILTECWIEEMLGYCQREDVGAVGAKLYFPDDTVQHAGVIIGLGGIAGHIFSGTSRMEYGYQARLISAQDLSAVTAACMMVKRSVFDQIGGFDEGFKVAFNDIDLCMKIRAIEKRIVFTPYAELYHYESKSRGKEETASQLQRFHNEISRFEKKWPDILKNGDPYYSCNLSLENGNCTLRH